MNHILTYKLEKDGIATITIDQKGNPTNLLNADFIRAYMEAAHQAIEDPKVKGVIVTSGQRMFMAGGDLRELEKVDSDPEEFFNGLMQTHQVFRTIETCGKPFVAAINGTALGGGMELCLACHYRIALNNSKIKLGFPEVKVGLFPGSGGTAKLPYLLGIQNGLMYLLQGIEARPDKARKDGLIDAVVDSPEEMIAVAKKWIMENPHPVQAWDDKKYRIPGGNLMSPNGALTLIGAIGNVRKQTHGNYPNAQYILSVVHDGLQLTIDRALEVEARYFTKAIQTKEAKHMIRTGFIEMQAAKKGKARPKGYDKYEVKKLGILGAGMMGAGIAFVSAKAGMEVVLKDVSVEAAEKGKSYSKGLMDKRITKGYANREQSDALLSRIHPTDDPMAIADCDLVIEAVFENPELKYKVTHEAEAVLGKDKIYASNTSTIPITQLAVASERPENYIGIHFFSPVDRMPLVEVIVGKKTSDRAIAASLDYIMAIGKIPIVVNDSRGFYTSRTFGTFASEGLFLLEEGVPAAMIENISKNKGMAIGPLAVLDEVSLTLSLHVYESDPSTDKPAYYTRSYDITKKLVKEYGREGKKAGKGLYDYPEGGKKHLWPELASIFKSDPETLDKETIGKRILHRQAVEAYRCLNEGVLRSSRDGDIGSILGWGFPMYTGGALSYIDYVGIEQFVEECDEFAERFGERFGVPESLRELAKAGKSVHDFSAKSTSVVN